MLNLALSLELARWRRAGRTARLWWRDDDAAGGSAALDRLLQASRASGAPLTLAAVPAGDMTGLAARVARTTLVSVVQHGVDHQNRRSGPAAGEFPHDWPRDELQVALPRGWSLLQAVPRAEPVFVPPWNDIHPELEAALDACSYAGWSVNGDVAGGRGRPDALPRVDAHIDLMRWRGGARFRGRARFLKTLANEMARRRRAGQWTAPIGLLTHHLAHDEAAWSFLERFLAWTSRRGEFAWTALPALLREAGEGREAAASASALRRPDATMPGARRGSAVGA
ncbi:MAG: polysaccharide deacetylase [Phenylobacterium sp.]